MTIFCSLLLQKASSGYMNMCQCHPVMRFADSPPEPFAQTKIIQATKAAHKVRAVEPYKNFSVGLINPVLQNSKTPNKATNPEAEAKIHPVTLIT